MVDANTSMDFVGNDYHRSIFFAMAAQLIMASSIIGLLFLKANLIEFVYGIVIVATVSFYLCRTIERLWIPNSKPLRSFTWHGGTLGVLTLVLLLSYIIWIWPERLVITVKDTCPTNWRHDGDMQDCNIIIFPGQTVALDVTATRHGRENSLYVRAGGADQDPFPVAVALEHSSKPELLEVTLTALGSPSKGSETLVRRGQSTEHPFTLGTSARLYLTGQQSGQTDLSLTFTPILSLRPSTRIPHQSVVDLRVMVIDSSMVEFRNVSITDSGMVDEPKSALLLEQRRWREREQERHLRGLPQEIRELHRQMFEQQSAFRIASRTVTTQKRVLYMGETLFEDLRCTYTSNKFDSGEESPLTLSRPSSRRGGPRFSSSPLCQHLLPSPILHNETRAP